MNETQIRNSVYFVPPPRRLRVWLVPAVVLALGAVVVVGGLLLAVGGAK